MLLKLGKVLHGMQNKRKDERGFTLIELLVVVIIIGILAAIAIPTFLGQRERAQDASAVADLRNGVTAVETYGSGTSPAYSFNGLATDQDPLGEIEPSITWDGEGTTVGNVGVTAAANAGTGESRGTYTIQTTSQSGKVYTAAADGNGQVAYEQDNEPFNP